MRRWATSRPPSSPHNGRTAKLASIQHELAIVKILSSFGGALQSLNRYSYGLNNPLRYSDPSGYIAEKEAAEAEDILDKLKDLFGILITKDWGWIEDELHQPYWVEGAWQLTELSAVQKAAEDLAAKMGGESVFRERIGAIHIHRYPGPSTSTLFRKNRYADAFVTSITLFDECFQQPDPGSTIVHEIAHVWDTRSWGSELIDDYVGSEWRPTKYATYYFSNGKYTDKLANRGEHWAETVSAWVYPNDPSVVQWSGQSGLYPWHIQYMSLAVSGFPMVQR